ncbi:hypothetical protein Tcan_03161 [Toxocara canis]|uniref:Uncharacterized protein n=1 Tax=Toxocara canis TaxID=6265 RepID=A0A0B2VEU7_TOXCA|nr:hypothetical protein Tcan_03161 [Toxocara canis]
MNAGIDKTHLRLGGSLLLCADDEIRDVGVINCPNLALDLQGSEIAMRTSKARSDEARGTRAIKIALASKLKLLGLSQVVNGSYKPGSLRTSGDFEPREPRDRWSDCVIVKRQE